MLRFLERRFSQRLAHLVQELKDLGDRSENSTFRVVDTVFLAEDHNDWLSFPHFVPRHAREQVVLDLVVKPAIPEVGNRIPDDVAACQNLPAQEADVVFLAERGHALVVRRKDGTHVEPQQRLMHGNEEHRVPPGEQVEQQAEVDGEVEGHQRRFPQLPLDIRCYQELNAYCAYANAL